MQQLKGDMTMLITVYNKNKIAASSWIGDWQTLRSKGFRDISFGVTNANGKLKLKFDVMDDDHKRFGFTKTLKGMITDLVNDKPVLSAAIDFDKPTIINRVNAMIEVITDIEQNFDSKPVNGDLVVTEDGSTGLVVNNTVIVAASSSCKQYVLSPFAHVISPVIAKKHFSNVLAEAMAGATRFYHVSFEHLKSQLPVAAHKPGFVYLNPKNTSEVYVYTGPGIFTNANNLDSKRGHLYVAIKVKPLTVDDLDYGKDNYTLADLKRLVWTYINDNTLTLNYDNYDDFVENTRWSNPFELTKNVRSIQLLELDKCFDPTKQLNIATKDGSINWLFMPK